MPEVEVMVSRLQKFVGREVWFVSPADGEDKERYNNETFEPPQKLNGVFRRGKFMVFMLEDRAILCHNAMSGYWDDMDEPWTFDYVEGARKSSASDVRAIMEVAGPHGSTAILQFHDARRFGSLRVKTPTELAEKLSRLGPEMIGSKHLYEPSVIITEAQFIELFEKSHKKAVKEVLMDQRRVAGVGNIYSAEACWAARIDPFRLGTSLTEAEASQLYHSCHGVLDSALSRSLDYGGLRIYRRKLCPGCYPLGEVKSKKLNGRTTYWCPSCQK